MKAIEETWYASGPDVNFEHPRWGKCRKFDGDDAGSACVAAVAPEALRMLRRVMYVGISAEMTEEIEHILKKARVEI